MKKTENDSLIGSLLGAAKIDCSPSEFRIVKFYRSFFRKKWHGQQEENPGIVVNVTVNICNEEIGNLIMEHNGNIGRP